MPDARSSEQAVVASSNSSMHVHSNGSGGNGTPRRPQAAGGAGVVSGEGSKEQ